MECLYKAPAAVCGGVVPVLAWLHYIPGGFLMEIVVSVFAVLVALGCFYAIYRSDRKDVEKDSKKSSED